MMIYSLNIAYLAAIICFILSLQGVSSMRTAKRSIFFGVLGMAIAIATTFCYISSMIVIIIVCLILGAVLGIIVGFPIDIARLPQLLTIFHILIGGAIILITYSILYFPASYGVGFDNKLTPLSLLALSSSIIWGVIACIGGIITLLKLQSFKLPNKFKGNILFNMLILLGIILIAALFCYFKNKLYFYLLLMISSIYTYFIILPRQNNEMSIVIPLLHSCAGWGIASIGIALGNSLLIVMGALIGMNGGVIAYIMNKTATNTFISLLIGKKTPKLIDNMVGNDRAIKTINIEDTVHLLKNVRSVIIVVGYGVACADAQYALKELVSTLMEYKIKVRFAIHKLAGRIPGHMNIILGEAGIDYRLIYEYEDIHHDFALTDMVLVVGANDITNPAFNNIGYMMPLNSIEKAKIVIVIKKTIQGTGYAGVVNSLFNHDHVMMLYGDAQNMIYRLIQSLQNSSINTIKRIIN